MDASCKLWESTWSKSHITADFIHTVFIYFPRSAWNQGREYPHPNIHCFSGVSLLCLNVNLKGIPCGKPLFIAVSIPRCWVQDRHDQGKRPWGQYWHHGITSSQKKTYYGQHQLRFESGQGVWWKTHKGLMAATPQSCKFLAFFTHGPRHLSYQRINWASQQALKWAECLPPQSATNSWEFHYPF